VSLESVLRMRLIRFCTLRSVLKLTICKSMAPEGFEKRAFITFVSIFVMEWVVFEDIYLIKIVRN
jgi:hypothetical protein